VERITHGEDKKFQTIEDVVERDRIVKDIYMLTSKFPKKRFMV
jgi:hypothetical protein